MDGIFKCLCVVRNDETAGSPSSLISSDLTLHPWWASFSPMQGSYTALLQYFQFGAVPSLSQTGAIPDNAQFITMLTDSYQTNGVLQINSVAIPLVLGTNGVLSGNISAWAGQTVQLTITMPSTGEPLFLLRQHWFFHELGTLRVVARIMVIGVIETCFAREGMNRPFFFEQLGDLTKHPHLFFFFTLPFRQIS